jgi:phospholipid N-methyltransferase
VAERARFLRSFVTHPRQVGAILPTSRRTARAMLDLAPIGQATCVVELGAGTGPITGELLRQLGADGRLLAFEVDPVLAGALRARFPDARLQVITDSAERLDDHLDGRRPEAIFSAVPFTSLPGDLGRRILETSRDALAPDGRMVVLQYSPFRLKDLRRVFGSVERRLSPLNVPPAMLFLCRPGAPGAA